ncbi:BZIP-like protein, putative [Medicago truncatula]|uniref:BZIP-like protein, putative n=1 Tax=Medicago truncatula TaxID=3880 RepID=G7K7E2_MEDTR|nr:BZIP-like protein, putative [Medicago truncatula]
MGSGKYLGLQSMIGRSEKSIFNYIKNRLWKLNSCWNSKKLSRTGKESSLNQLLKGRWFSRMST